MQDFFLIPIQTFTQNPFFLILMNYTHEDIRYLSPFLSIVKHPITRALWGVYKSHLDSLFYVHYPKCYSGLSYIFQFSARRFPREYSCDRFVFVYYPEYYSGFSYIFQFSAREFSPLSILAIASCLFISPNIIRVLLYFYVYYLRFH